MRRGSGVPHVYLFIFSVFISGTHFFGVTFAIHCSRCFSMYLVFIIGGRAVGGRYSRCAVGVHHWRSCCWCSLVLIVAAFTALCWSCPVVRSHVRFPVSLQLGSFHPSDFAIRCFSVGLVIFFWSVVPMLQLSWRLRCLRHVRFSLLMSQASLILRFC